MLRDMTCPMARETSRWTGCGPARLKDRQARLLVAALGDADGVDAEDGHWSVIAGSDPGEGAMAVVPIPCPHLLTRWRHGFESR